MADNTKNRELISWVKSIGISLVIVVGIRTFVFSPYIVDGASMEPTLHDHEKIFVNKVNTTGNINRQDIVIIKGNDENYVKRVIGLPGDTVEVKDDNLIINGNIVKEDYLNENRKNANQHGSVLTGDYGPLVVPDGNYFVMGDNRLRSMDSRNGLGLIKEDMIVGISEFVFYPFSNVRLVD